MDSGKQHKVYAPDGLQYGYFLDGRLYEYRTSTCIGFLDEAGQLVDENGVLGKVMDNLLLIEDGTCLRIDP